MRKIFHKFLQEKTRWNFQKADLLESARELNNPVRGWYEIHTFLVEEEPDLRALSWCEATEDCLALVIINIGAYRESVLDETALNHIHTILNFYRENHYDIILRITYDHEGNAVEREPFFYSQVLEHLHQVCELLQEYEDIIFVYQGMLIGNWGEMHTSRFLSPAKMKEMWAILKEALGPRSFLAVRRPAFWRLLHPEGCGKKQLPYDRTGLFDDAIFGSVSHLGTFGTEPKEVAGWEGLWTRQEELGFEERLCSKVPNGGEVLCGEFYPQTGKLMDTVELLRRMHITYLNKAYDEQILNIWKKWKWEETGIWQNVSGYDYIGRHMGYRFCIRNVSVTLKDKEKPTLLVAIDVENVGFANFYQEAVVTLEWEDEAGGRYFKHLDCDMRTWHSGSTQRISGEMVLMNGRLYLSAKRKQDGRKIYFANNCQPGGKVLLGQITDVQLR